MSEPEVQPEAGINPIDNLEGWLDAKTRDAEPEEPTGQSEQPASPAEPTLAATADAAQPAPVDWREVVLPDDVPHGFFKGKKVPDVIESYKHAERAKQEAERKASELARELEQIRREREAEAAVRRVTGAPTQQEPQPISAADQWFENPREAERILTERAVAEAKRIAEQTIAAERSQVEYQQRQKAMFDTAHAAVERVAAEYGMDRQRAEAVVAGTFSYLGMHEAQANDPNVWLNADNYVSIVRQMIGDPIPKAPTPTIPNVPVPQLSNPPVSGRPVATQQRTASEPSPLAREEEAKLRALAREMGVDPKDYIDRVTRRLGGARG